MNVGYIISHWRGNQSLAKAVFLNGVLGYFLLILSGVALYKVMPSVFDTRVFFYTGPAIFLAWFVWAAAGIVRCAIKIVLSGSETVLRRLFGSIAIIGVIIVVAISLNDLWRLFGKDLVG